VDKVLVDRHFNYREAKKTTQFPYCQSLHDQSHLAGFGAVGVSSYQVVRQLCYQAEEDRDFCTMACHIMTLYSTSVICSIPTIPAFLPHNLADK